MRVLMVLVCILLCGCAQGKRDAGGMTPDQREKADGGARWMREHEVIPRIAKRRDALQQSEGNTRRVVVLSDVLAELEKMRP